MKIDDSDYDALCDAVGEQVLQELAAWSTRLGLPGDPTTSWTAVPPLQVLVRTYAALNVAMRDNLSLDDAAALLESDQARDRKARNRGPSVNLARWRRNIRNK